MNNIFLTAVYNSKRKTHLLAIQVLSVYDNAFIQVDFVGNTLFLFMVIQLSHRELIIFTT
jgi:hypothetical protein